jgi:hypothetical protein
MTAIQLGIVAPQFAGVVHYYKPQATCRNAPAIVTTHASFEFITMIQIPVVSKCSRVQSQCNHQYCHGRARRDIARVCALRFGIWVFKTRNGHHYYYYYNSVFRKLSAVMGNMWYRPGRAHRLHFNILIPCRPVQSWTKSTSFLP